jgi:acylaminoacyl-peptidase
LLWLAEASGGAHVSTDILHFAPNSTSDNLTDPDTLVGVVEHPRSEGFPGLYPAANLPSSLLLSINSDSPTHIALHTAFGSRTVVLLVSFKGEITVLDPGDTYSWAVLATDGKSQIICSRSTPAVPYEIVVADIRDVQNVSWNVVDQPAIDEDGKLRFPSSSLYFFAHQSA